MDISFVVSFILHIDTQLEILVQNYGVLSYAIVFLIIFCETGLVITPFLPGDSLLFAVGFLSARGLFDPVIMALGLSIAAVVGDSVNYSIGSRAGERILKMNLRVLKPQYVEKTRAFYVKYGARTILFSRFVPIVRTIAPFMAGVAKMPYTTFATYNVVGGIFWVNVFLWGGYVFGNMPFVQNNFGVITILIVIVSILPAVIEWLRERKKIASKTEDETIQ